jgi:hypothetical protein
LIGYPIAARAQQPMPVVGFLDLRSPEAMTGRLRGFRQGLGETGLCGRRQRRIAYRWGENKIDRVPELAVDLVRRKVAVNARDWKYCRRIDCKGGHHDDPDPFHQRRRPGAARSCHDSRGIRRKLYKQYPQYESAAPMSRRTP